MNKNDADCGDAIICNNGDRKEVLNAGLLRWESAMASKILASPCLIYTIRTTGLFIRRYFGTNAAWDGIRKVLLPDTSQAAICHSLSGTAYEDQTLKDAHQHKINWGFYRVTMMCIRSVRTCIFRSTAMG